MVTGASEEPRVWSVLLTGGKREGASGPGVGSPPMVVHEGGVGMTMLGRVEIASGDKVGEAVHEDSNKRKDREETRMDLMRGMIFWSTRALSLVMN
jgi:hypothetical protein